MEHSKNDLASCLQTTRAGVGDEEGATMIAPELTEGILMRSARI